MASKTKTANLGPATMTRQTPEERLAGLAETFRMAARRAANEADAAKAKFMQDAGEDLTEATEWRLDEAITAEAKAAAWRKALLSFNGAPDDPARFRQLANLARKEQTNLLNSREWESNGRSAFASALRCNRASGAAKAWVEIAAYAEAAQAEA
jgi:hypothetical protein